MKWPTYKRRFFNRAKAEGFNKDYIKQCLDYAYNLFTRNLPIIYDQEHVSLLVGYNLSYLLRASNKPDAFYREFEILKKNGGKRKISEPLPSLKEIQRWILDNILYKCEVSRFAKAFIPSKSIKENARFHRGQRLVLSLDIKDFFSSIKFDKVYSLYKSIGYSKSVAVLLAKLSTLNNCLPQGAPTSPALSNLISHRIDKRFSSFAIKNKVRYTRYADDITFSGNFNVGNLIRLATCVLDDEKLSLNQSKTRLMMKHQKQEVTGIVVNEKLQAPRALRRKVRQEVYYINKYGLDSHLNAIGSTRANYIEHLKGLVQFVIFVNEKDTEFCEYLKYLKEYT